MFNTPRSSLRPSSLRGGHSARGRSSTVRPPASGQGRANFLDQYNEISKRLQLHTERKSRPGPITPSPEGHSRLNMKLLHTPVATTPSTSSALLSSTRRQTSTSGDDPKLLAYLNNLRTQPSTSHNKADLKKLDKVLDNVPSGRGPMCSSQSDNRGLNRYRCSCSAIPHAAQLFGVEQRSLRIS
jgi:hypothetical protein